VEARAAEVFVVWLKGERAVEAGEAAEYCLRRAGRCRGWRARWRSRA